MGPWEIDEALRQFPAVGDTALTGPVATPQMMYRNAVLAYPLPDVAAAHGFISGFSTVRTSGPDEGQPRGLQNVVLLFPYPGAAAAAAGEMAGKGRTASRFMLALQHQRGVSLDTATTALRTAFLTAIAQRDMASPIALPSKNTLVLTAGDLDEAVAGLLNNGLAASDVNGKTVPTGFTRIMAYRSGLQSDVDACFTRLP